MQVLKKLWKRISNHLHLLSARVAKEPRLQFRAASQHGALYDMKSASLPWIGGGVLSEASMETRSKLLGIRQIPHSYDIGKARQAIDDFRSPSRAVRGKPTVYLHVSAEGLKLIDDDWNLLIRCPLDSVSVSYDDVTDPRVYAFVGVDAETETTCCVCLRAFQLTGITGETIQCAVDAAFAKMHVRKVQELKVQQVIREELYMQEDADTEPGLSGLNLESDEIGYSGDVQLTDKWSPSSDSEGIDYIFKVRHAMLNRSWRRHQYGSSDDSQESD